jgi:hypothetical protein
MQKHFRRTSWQGRAAAPGPLVATGADRKCAATPMLSTLASSVFKSSVSPMARSMSGYGDWPGDLFVVLRKPGIRE